MADLAVLVVHQLPRREALERATRLLAEAVSGRSGEISDLEEKWNGNVCTFRFSAGECRISGTLTVETCTVRMAGNLVQGRLEDAAFDKIRSVIKDRIQTFLS